MLPTPETSVWSSSARLIPVRRRRSAAVNAAASKAGSSGSRRDVRDRGGDAVGAVAGVLERQPAERALVDEAQLAAAVGEA